MEKVSTDHTVEFNGTSIKTTVTNDPWKVEVVLSELRVSLAANNNRRDRVVGFDINYQTHPSGHNSIATLQLCHGTRCLIIQLARLPLFSFDPLIRFLNDNSIQFVGVDISNGFKKLSGEYTFIPIPRTCIELGQLIDQIRTYCILRYSNLLLSELTAEILGVVYVKPECVAHSNWSVRVLTSEQVQCATLDAYVPVAIMKKLSPEIALKDFEDGVYLEDHSFY